jgi:hypothetical protein
LQSGRPIWSRWRPLCGENLHDRLQKVTGGLEQTSELYARSLPCPCVAFQPYKKKQVRGALRGKLSSHSPLLLRQTLGR